jgi:hypothetical protein
MTRRLLVAPSPGPLEGYATRFDGLFRLYARLQTTPIRGFPHRYCSIALREGEFRSIKKAQAHPPGKGGHP